MERNEQEGRLPALLLISTDSRGNQLLREPNEVGGHRYWSDEIGGGAVVWDTSIISEEMLQLALGAEQKRKAEENL